MWFSATIYIKPIQTVDITSAPNRRKRGKICWSFKISTGSFPTAAKY